MNNKQLGRKLSTEKTNEKAAITMKTIEINITTIEDWAGNVLKTFEGEQTELADETIQEMVYMDILKDGFITKDENFEEWETSNEETYNSYREEYYIECYDKKGNKVVWSW